LFNIVNSICKTLAKSVIDSEEDIHDKYGSVVGSQLIFMAVTQFYADAVMFYVSAENRSTCIEHLIGYITHKTALEDVAGTA